jgi:colanic acid biosynthesis protein WcaH
MNNLLDEKSFLDVINNTPLIAIDLIIEDSENRVLLGKRLNRPAQGYWFVPGGRIRKNEKIAEAIERITSAELGIAISLSDAQLFGVYDHIYEDNCLGVDGVNTHYVVMAFKVIVHNNFNIVPDSQHSELKWWTKNSLLDASDVHQNTKAYYLGA